MSLPTLALPPDQNGYQVQFGDTNESTKLDGGASRFRADRLGAAFTLPVQWTMSKKNYNYLMAFYRTTIVFGSLPFIIGLIIDSGDVVNYNAHFVPGTLQLISQSGLTYIVGATLEVFPNAVDATADAALVTAGPDV